MAVLLSSSEYSLGSGIPFRLHTAPTAITSLCVARETKPRKEVCETTTAACF